MAIVLHLREEGPQLEHLLGVEVLERPPDELVPARSAYIPDMDVVEGVEVEGDVRLRVVARSNLPGEPELSMWVRANLDAEGLISLVVIQPDSQEEFDRGIGPAWASPDDRPPADGTDEGPPSSS